MKKNKEKVRLFEKVEINDNEVARTLYEKEKKGFTFKLICTVVNARIFMRSGSVDGPYTPSLIYTPRIYQVIDDCDISITTMINYEMFDLAPLESSDYITIYCPELLNLLASAIFGVLTGEMTVIEAIAYLEKEVLRSE